MPAETMSVSSCALRLFGLRRFSFGHFYRGSVFANLQGCVSPGFSDCGLDEEQLPLDFLRTETLAIERTSERRSFPLQSATKAPQTEVFSRGRKTQLPVPSELLTHGQASERRGQDSNLRTSFPVTGLANPRFRPLSHLSGLNELSRRAGSPIQSDSRL